MKIEYIIKGITLDVNDLMAVTAYYKRACTAEYIFENYPQIENEAKAMDLAYEVRRLMDKYNYDEFEAVENILQKNHYL